jgi:hypothetical protein
MVSYIGSQPGRLSFETPHEPMSLYSMASSSLKVNVFDGTRQPIDPGKKILITITDGTAKQIVRSEFPSGTTFEVPFHDNFGDNYTVLAFVGGYEQAGFMPVVCSPNVPQVLDLMLLKKDSGFNFAAARWETLGDFNPDLANLLAHGAADAGVARFRYTQLMESQPAVLACLFNITTAMASINLRAFDPLHYCKELIWDNTMAQDRFFAYADPELYEEVKLAAHQGEFSQEIGFAAFHPGATDSYKQIQFGEANVQLTFHANDTKVIDGLTCIKIEPDIDYFKDLLSHALLEVIVNGISGNLTDPRQVYVLRWIAGRHAGVDAFNPPYVIA